jgi:PTH1 family peptidyl-tRNA hydrolase
MFGKLKKALSGKKQGASASAFAWLVVGLGNPGAEHEDQRHNIGFMAADRMAADYNFADWRAKFQGFAAEGSLNGQRVMLLKPQTYMNRSGQSVAEAARFYKIPPANIVVMHDELDLPLGKVRVKTGGGAAGHNGLKSIDADLGDQNYRRVRIGIGHPGEKSRVSGYVLSGFSGAERHTADIMVAAISRHIDLLLAGRESDFMTKISEETKVK